MVEAKVKAILIFKVINKATMENNIGNAGWQILWNKKKNKLSNNEYEI
jgi:hypothetical protein